MRTVARLSLLLAAAAACNFPRPPDVKADDDGEEEPDVPPGISLHVAGTGDDANDGVTKPIKTLKHAIGLAAANDQVTSIVLASGRYSTAGGELFPYTLPANVVLVGAAGGGAILAGSNAEPGLIVNAGTLRDLELEDFTVAITVRGAAQLTDLHVRTKTVAVQGEASAAIRVDNLDIAGAAGACATGIELHGAADLNATNLVTRALKTAVNAQDQSMLTLVRANLTGDNACSNPPTGVFVLSTTSVFSLSESVIDGGDNGIYFVGTGTPTQATVTDTTIKRTKGLAVLGSRFSLNVTGGEFSDNAGGIGAKDARVSLTGVVITQQRGSALELGGGGTFAMRNCTVTANSETLYQYSDMAIDLGTAASPGNNVLQHVPGGIGLQIESGVTVTIYAVGNTWRPNVQGTDAAGHYASSFVSGPVSYVFGNNYAFSAGASL